MNKTMKKLMICCAAGLLTVAVASASPVMAPVSEVSSDDSVVLDIVNVVGDAATVSEELDLIALIAAWSEAVPLNTSPFVGLIMKLF